MTTSNHTTHNDMVATVPIEKLRSSTAKIIGGMALIDEKLSLVPLKVVFESDDFYRGQIVFVDSKSALNQPWATRVYTLDGLDFILVPKAMVILSAAER